MQIRAEQAGDLAAIDELHRICFPSDAESRLVRALRDADYLVASLVADRQGEIVGHVAFSRLIIDTAGRAPIIASLAPLAVLPEFRRRGIGASLVRQGLAECAARGMEAVVVLGEPGYYRRFRFDAALTRQLECEYQCDAFQAVELTPNALRNVQGRVVYPAPFQDL